VRVAVHFDLIEPVFDMRESFFSGDVVNQQGSNGASVVGASNGPEVLLAGSVPDLQLDILILDGNGFGTEFDSNSDVVSGTGLAFDELEDDAGFTNSGVSDDYELEKVVIRIHN